MAQDSEAKQIVFANVREMPPLAVSLGDTRYNLTGSWRRLRPVYGEWASPCEAGCPNGNQVRRMVGLVAAGRLNAALAVLRETNPLPGVTGRVCYHPCEATCNRAQLDEPLAVQAIERFVAEYGTPDGDERRPDGDERRLKPAATGPGRRVAVIGSGPAGLSCAYHLARRGHMVVLYEAQPELGGLLRYAIPTYRLPRRVLDREIELLLESGDVEVHTGKRFGRDFGPEDLDLFDGVFVATGAQRSRRLGLAGEEMPGVLSGLALLRAAATGQPVCLGRQVLVIGGGNTAVDAARVARRLGAAEVTIAYRRTRKEMPAIADEVAAAEAEGIGWRFEAAPVALLAQDGRVAGAQLAPTRPAGTGADGRPALELAGPAFTVPASAVVVAIGEDVDETAKLGQPLGTRDGGEGPFWLAGGDCAGDTRRVVDAIAAGRHAALALDRHFRGLAPDSAAPPPMIGFERLNAAYFEARARVAARETPLPRRLHDFREVAGTLAPGAVAHEAARCFQCGVCTQCDNCWLFCPDVAVERSDDGYRIDYAYCKGCGVCAAECPRGAIAMREEASQ